MQYYAILNCKTLYHSLFINYHTDSWARLLSRNYEDNGQNSVFTMYFVYECWFGGNGTKRYNVTYPAIAGRTAGRLFIYWPNNNEMSI